jgi:hypothetical protein
MRPVTGLAPANRVPPDRQPSPGVLTTILTTDEKVVQYNSETGWLDFLMQVGVLPLK